RPGALALIPMVADLRRRARSRAGRAAAALAGVLAAGGPASLACAASGAAASAAACLGTVYLTFDTGNMRDAELVAATLARHGVRATFFLANERTTRGDHALDDGWRDWWRARAAEGHAFGSHTMDHVYFAGMAGGQARA